jgi:hypothetical protein
MKNLQYHADVLFSDVKRLSVVKKSLEDKLSQSKYSSSVLETKFQSEKDVSMDRLAAYITLKDETDTLSKMFANLSSLEATNDELILQLETEENNRKQSEEAKKNLDTQYAEFRKKYDSDMTVKDALMDETRRMLMKEVNFYYLEDYQSS